MRNAAVAVAFTVMGVFVLRLASSSQMTSGPDFQVAIGKGLAEVFHRIEAWAAPVPEPLLGAAVLALASVFVYVTLADRPATRGGADGGAGDVLAHTDSPTCHSHEPTA